MRNLRNRIDIRLVNKEKYYLKQTSKRRYMSQKLFDNNLGATCKSKAILTINKAAYTNKAILTINKAAYTKKCMPDLNKVLIYEFIYDYISINYSNNSKL